MHTSQNRTGERGFTLIELLVVILIIGVLVAIAIPSFLSQKGKAVDASAKETARTGAQAAETYSTDHNGEYTGIAPEVLQGYEKALRIAAGNGSAYLSSSESQEGGKGYKITATAPNGDTFTLAKSKTGDVERTCTVPAGNSVSGCISGSW